MKTFRKIVLSFCLLFALTILSACGEAKVTDIYIQEDSINLTVEHNSTWSTDDIVVKAKLSNGKEKVITNVEFSEIDTSRVGEQVLTVTYGVYEYKVTITVTPTISSYELKGVDTQVNHKSTIDLSGAYVQVTYSDSTQTNFHNGFTVTDEGTEEVGAHKYHLTFGSHTQEFDYTVVKTVKSLAVSGVTVDEIIYGNTYDTSGITAVVTYSAGSPESLTNDKLFFTLPENKLGDQKLIVSYTDSISNTTAEQKFDVKVIQVLENISVGFNPENSTAGYHVLGEEFDETQFKVYANYSKDKNVSLNLNDVDITNIPTASSSLGTHTITFTYEGKTATKNITIVDSYADIPNEGLVVTSISIDPTTISSIKYGEELDLSNLAIIATYNNNPEMTARLNYSDYSAQITTAFDNTPVYEAGNTTATSTLTVTYEGLTATHDVTVNRVLKSLVIDDQFTTTYNYGAEFTLPTVYAIYTDCTDSENRYPVTVTADIQNVTTPAKEEFENGVAIINVEYTYNYSYVDVANGGKNFVSHDITINDVVGSILVDETSIPDNAIVGKDYDVSTLKIKETYVSGNTNVYSYLESDNKYSITFDKSTAGYKDFTAILNSNNEVTNSVEVYVRDFYALSLSAPAFISNTYNKNSNNKNEYDNQLAEGASDKTKGFAKTATELSYTYKVGDDNPFKFSPILQADFNGTQNRANNYKLGAQVYLNDSTTPLSGEDLDKYVSIDYKNHTLDFTEEAIKVDKIKIKVGLGFTLTNEEYLDYSSNLQPIEFSFEVVDGWNVYTARDLSVIDNTNIGGKWTTIKTANEEKGLEDLTGVQTNGIILHSDILITKDDIPSCHFYSDTNTDGLQGGDLAKVNGYMIQEDHYTKLGIVYNRVINDKGTFNIEGNFFTIDISNKNKSDKNGTTNQATFPHVKKVVADVEKDKAIVISTTLFGFTDEHTEDRERGFSDKIRKDICIGFADENEETCNINNLSLIGNSNKNEEIVGQAGLVCYKTENVNFTMTNCLSQAWYISHFFEGSTRTGDKTKQILKDCNAFDAYNSLIYAQGARDLQLIDCTMIGAGGPVMICDEEVYYVNGTKSTYAKNIEYTYSHSFDGKNSTTEPILVDERMTFVTKVTTTNCNLHSWVGGREQWFNAFNAGNEVDKVKAIDGLIKESLQKGGINMTILDSSGIKLNIIAVYKSAESIDINTVIDIQGTYKDSKYDFGLDFNNNNITGQHVMQTFTGALIPTSGTQSAINYSPETEGKTEQEIIEDVTNEIIRRITTANDYLALYLANGMGVVLGASKAS